jgi:outer membrane immunogenic protein
MRRLAALSFLVAFVLPATAADPFQPGGRVYTYQGPATVRLYSWNGIYVGGHMGVGWNDTVGSDDGGFIGGAQVGFNVRSGQAVFGLEGQWTGSSIDGDDDLRVLPDGALGRLQSEIDWLATLTGRVGLVWDRSLFYLKGGAAWVENSYDVAIAGQPGLSLSGDETRTGWAVGIGYEYAFRNAWSARLEFLHMDFGSDRVSLDGPGPGLALPNVDQQVHALTLGVNYRFDWRILGPLGTPE